MRHFRDNQKANKLSANTKKTEYVVFGTKHKLANKESIVLTLGNQVLKEADSYKYLGTTLDPTVSGNKQLS